MRVAATLFMLAALPCWLGLPVFAQPQDPVQAAFRRHPGLKKLQKEVAKKGWIIFSAKSSQADWDLFVMRPDGSRLRQLTNTREWSEVSPRYSPDGKSVLYRRIKAGVKVQFERWGFQGQLVVADRNVIRPRVIGGNKDYPWGCWNPDGTKISCLSRMGISIFDVKTLKLERKLARRGVFQQLFWSPDGRWFIGTGNTGGESWGIVRLNVKTGRRNFVSVFRKCTPDWFPDSRRVVFSNRAKGQKGYGWTQLWQADGIGKNPKLIYGEDERHCYGAVISPDSKYVVFTRCPLEGGGAERIGAPGCLMRLSDGPIIAGESKAVRKEHRRTKLKDGPVLPLPYCWEPHWTYVE